jgi:hypothetical protein
MADSGSAEEKNERPTSSESSDKDGVSAPHPRVQSSIHCILSVD